MQIAAAANTRSNEYNRTSIASYSPFLYLEPVGVRPHVPPAIHFGDWETEAVEKGSDVGAVLDAVVDDLHEELAGLGLDGLAVLLLIDDLGGRDALNRIHDVFPHLCAKDR